MPKEIDVTLIRVKHKDKFNLKKLYYMMHEWLVQEEWESRKDENFNEIFAGRNDSNSNGSEVWWFWRPEKVINSYLKWKMDINGHVLMLRKVEEVVDGKKFKTNWGEVEVWVRVKLVADHAGKWKNHPILKNFEPIYRKRIIKKDIEKEKKALKAEAYRFQEAIKDFLGLRKGTEETEAQGNFFARGGVGE